MTLQDRLAELRKERDNALFQLGEWKLKTLELKSAIRKLEKGIEAEKKLLESLNQKEK